MLRRTKPAAHAVREGEAPYQQLVELSPDGMLIQCEGKIVFANGACVKLLGAVTPEQLIGRPVLDFVPPEYHEIVRARMREVRERGQPLPVEEKRIRLDGTFVDVEITVAPFMHEGMRAAQVIMRDISRRRPAQEKIRETQAFLSSIVDNIPHMVFVKDARELRFVRLNKAGEEILGYSEHELLGKNDYDFFPRAQADFFVAKDRQTLAQGRKTSITEEPVTAKNGTVKLLQTKKLPILDEHGAPLYLLGISEDITERKQLEQVRDALAGIVEHANDAIISRTLDGTVLSWNAGAKRMLGYTAMEAIGRSVTFILPPGQPSNLVQNTERILRGEVVPPHESRRVTKDGRIIDVLISLSPLKDRSGKIVGTSVIFQDISALKRAERAARESEERFHATFEQAGVGMALGDIDSEPPRWLRVNQKLSDILGYTKDELLEINTLHLSPRKERALARHHTERLARGEIASDTREQRYVRKDGKIIWVNITRSVITGVDGRASHMISVIQDTTENRRTAERIAYLAQYDSLTGLPNRNLFRDRLTHALGRAKRSEKLLALMSLDLDRFKEINETLGHPTGDEVLRALAGRLRAARRESDTVARLGGDEFMLILENITDVNQAGTLAQDILQTVSQPFVIRGREIFVTASIGIAIYPFGEDDVDALLQTTDIAMYRAKEEGRNTYEFYDVAMNAHAAESLEMENLLRRALEREEFVLHYQPKISVRTGRITGVEALIRWNSRELGLVSPVKFIPLAEKTGLILTIGEWVLKSACVQNKLWQEWGHPPIVMSVNLSQRQFRQKHLVQTVVAALQGTGLDPRFLELEITESMIMLNADKTVAVLHELHELGVQLSIDDFGTGYSSLAYLKKFPVQKLKIDRSFIQDLDAHTDKSGIVTAVIAMAKSLGLGVVAEGVETRQQLAWLARLNCDEYQGYYFSRPVPAEAFAALFTAAPNAYAAE